MNHRKCSSYLQVSGISQESFFSQSVRGGPNGGWVEVPEKGRCVTQEAKDDLTRSEHGFGDYIKGPIAPDNQPTISLNQKNVADQRDYTH